MEKYFAKQLDKGRIDEAEKAANLELSEIAIYRRQVVAIEYGEKHCGYHYVTDYKPQTHL